MVTSGTRKPPRAGGGPDEGSDGSSGGAASPASTAGSAAGPTAGNGPATARVGASGVDHSTASSEDPDEDSFASALADACAGGTAGLTILFRTYQPRLLRYLRSREPRQADDIAGETWAAVASRIRWFEGDARSFAAWLFTIARQRLADHRRTSIRRRTDPVPTVAEIHAGPPIDETVIDKLSAQEATDLIVRMLSQDQSEVVLLRTLGGLNAAEVASVMGRDATWVRVTHHRAMQRLRDRWTPPDRSRSEV